jgi:O-acetylhomoserine (thiol)-lyase
VENIVVKGFTTRAIHSPFAVNDAHKALRMPVYDSVSFELESAEEMEAAFAGRKVVHAYSRITNPTVEDFEQRIKAITGAFAVAALSSGMAAISTAILSIAGNGDNLIASKFLFGDTYSFFKDTLANFGIEVRLADPLNPDSFECLVDERTRALYLETVTNPLLYVPDLESFSSIAKRHEVALVVDTTMTPPFLFDSKKFGVDVEVLSATKAISGGATVLGGLIIDNGTYDWGNNRLLAGYAKKFGPFAFISKIRKQTVRYLGSCLTPHNAYLLSLGLETLALRLEKACSNALVVAKYLDERPEIKTVNYPGLVKSPFYEIVARQFPRLPGPVVSFELEGKERCFAFINALRVIRRSTNLHDNKSLCIHSASTILAHLSEKERLEAGVTPSCVRLSVGIEDVEDIISDIEQALEGGT